MISREVLTRLINDIKGRNVVEGLQLAQLHFPGSKIAWGAGSDEVKQILTIDEYAIVFEQGKVSVGYVRDIVPTEIGITQAEIDTLKDKEASKKLKKKKVKQPLIS